MGAVETMMLDCAYCEIGQLLGLPTQAYIALSDAKQLDAQAGLETGMGATLAALAGVNSVSGPGMLDFESCQSLEKLVVDNEICGMRSRLVAGYRRRATTSRSRPLFEELLREEHLLIAAPHPPPPASEIAFPGPVDRPRNRSPAGSRRAGSTLGQRARREVERLVAARDAVAAAADEASRACGR